MRRSFYRLTIYKSWNGNAYADEWRWTLRGPNGRIIGASSEGFRKRANCAANFRQVTGTTPARDRDRGKWEQANWMATRQQFEQERRLERTYRV
jgi:uncharacterized protein YegP (UPF0339 family)